MTGFLGDDIMNHSIQEGIKVSFITILGNLFLSIFKFIAGIFGKSQAMLSDSIHSLSDVLSTVVVMIGLKLSSKKADIGHPYGHERIECVAAFLLAIFLFITGLGIGWMGLSTILTGNYHQIKSPTFLALGAAIISILSKEMMYWYTRSVAIKLKSDSLMADAWHHRSDSLSSVGSLIGISGAMLGFPLLDPIASIIICLFILKVSYNIFMDSVDKMVDKSCSLEFIEKLKTAVFQIEGVENIDSLKTRLFGNRIYVDIEISADEDLPLKDAHKIAQNVHDEIEKNFEDVKHCMVHMNPKNINR